MTRSSLAIWGVAGLTLAHLAAVVMFFGDPDGLRLTHDLAGWAAALTGMMGTVAAARTFSREDHLRRVWVAFATGATLLVLGQALRSYWTHTAPLDFLHSPLLWPRMVVVAGANLATTCGLILLTSTYARSGLRVPPTLRFRALWILLSAGALFLGVRQLRLELGRFGGGPEGASALTVMFSTVGDTAMIVLIAPILRIAYLMRGGQLAKVWWAMGLSGAAWLLYDCKEWIGPWMPGTPEEGVELLRALRTPGLALVGLAGLLQREAVRVTPEVAAEPAVAPALGPR